MCVDASRPPPVFGHAVGACRSAPRMLGLVAENAALEDALYYLDQGVTEGAITVDVFLKEVRRLARKQFVARATMKKVRPENVYINEAHTSLIPTCYSGSGVSRVGKSGERGHRYMYIYILLF